MKIEKIQSQILTPKTTGYASTIGLGLTVLTGIVKNKSIRKTHKPLAYITTFLTALHIGLIEYYYHKYSSKKNL